MEGAEVFDTLQNVIRTLEESGASSFWGKEAQETLKEGKRYLKTNFKSHVRPDGTCVDHCTKFSLSDPQNDVFTRECNHSHNTTCTSCCQLDEVLRDIMSMFNFPRLHLTDQQQNQVMFDVNHAVETINVWKAHLLWTVNQEQAKQEALSVLNEEAVLIVMDWAIKYLPRRYREQMSDVYGKRGKSWHVSCMMFNSGEKEYSVETFVHVFDSCT